MMKLIRAESDDHFEHARSLFEEYAAALGVDLCFQNFADELANLRQQYSPPHGRLLLASHENELVGCVG